MKKNLCTVAQSTGPITPARAADRKAAKLEKIRVLREQAAVCRDLASETRKNRNVHLDGTTRSGLIEVGIHLRLAFSLEDAADRLEGK